MEDPSELSYKIEAAASAISAHTTVRPKVAITLGTGLGGLVDKMEVEDRINHCQLPGFPEPRVLSQDGHLVFGTLGNCPVVALEGRYHYYEGYTLDEITLPVRVVKKLGVDLAIFSNAAGGLNPQFRTGDIMLISDHINLMGVNPLIGPNDDALGPRFPDMIEPYDMESLETLERLALASGLRTQRGVYAALTGPSLETRAEYRFLRTIGADAVGMSTVPEVIAAVHCGLKSVGISCITDLCLPDALEPVNIDEILRVAGEAEPHITRLVSEFTATLAAS